MFVHFIPYFEDATVEDILINNFSEITLLKRNAEKQTIQDLNFSEKYVKGMFQVLLSINQIHFTTIDDEYLSVMLPINKFRFSGKLGRSIKSGIECTIRLNSDEINFSFEAFTIEKTLQDQLLQSVQEKKTMFIVGGSGSGKTTFTNILIQHFPLNENIKAIGDISDYVFKEGSNVSHMITKTAKDYAECFDLMMRSCPDRILISELTIDNVNFILRVINSGIKGVILTLHASGIKGVASAFSQNLALNKDKMKPEDIQKLLDTYIDVFLFFEKNNQGQRTLKDFLFNCSNNDIPMGLPIEK